MSGVDLAKMIRSMRRPGHRRSEPASPLRFPVHDGHVGRRNGAPVPVVRDTLVRGRRGAQVQAPGRRW